MRCPKCQVDNPDDAYRCADPDCLAPLRPMGATVPAAINEQSPLETTSGSTPAPLPESPLEPDALPVPGDVLWGRFEIEAELGRGGMGAVFRAKDSAGGETVAVKVLLPQLSADRGARERLRTEVLRARSLRHDGVVAVYEFSDDEPLVGFWMELLKGHTLAEHLEGQVPGSPLGGKATPDRLPWVAEIAEQVAEALDYIHDKDLVHRDVKPSNVLITGLGPDSRPEELRAILLDFGIAHVVGGPRATQVGVSGSAGHIAPELQISGADPTPAADLWSFGMLVYHALTGTAEIPTRDMLSPSDHVDGLPPELDEVVMACFNRVGTRTQRASVVATALREALVGCRMDFEEERRSPPESTPTDELDGTPDPPVGNTTSTSSGEVARGGQRERRGPFWATHHARRAGNFLRHRPLVVLTGFILFISVGTVLVTSSNHTERQSSEGSLPTSGEPDAVQGVTSAADAQEKVSRTPIVVDTGGPPAVVVSAPTNGRFNGQSKQSPVVTGAPEPTVPDPSSPAKATSGIPPTDVAPATASPATGPAATVTPASVPVAVVPRSESRVAPNALAVSCPLSEIKLVAVIPDAAPPRAVVRFPSGAERVVQAGDVLGAEGSKVVAFSEGSMKLTGLVVVDGELVHTTHYMHLPR